MKQNALHSCIWIFVVFTALSACASKPVQTRPLISASFPDLENGAWRACRFKITWPAHLGADGAVDLMLAHAVVRPVLKEQVTALALWRFHRRAARDATGHQFSFMFYADADVSAKIARDIQANPILKEALSTKILERAWCDDPNTPRPAKVEAMSDPSWSPALQKNWPAYIMGVSALWLGLIDDAMTDAPVPKNISSRLEQYRKADAAVTALWRKEGQHAFFHHLSAVFGYAPLLIQKEIQF